MIAGQVQRFAERLRRLVGGKGSYSLTLLDDIMPYFDVLSQVPEEFWNRKEFLYSYHVTLANPGVGLFATLVLQPADNLHVVTIDYVAVTKAAAGTVRFSVLTPANVVVLSPLTLLASQPDARDGRNQGTDNQGRVPLKGFSSGPGGLVPGLYDQSTAAGALSVFANIPSLVATFGSPFCLQDTTSNEGMTLDVAGRARQLAPEEAGF